MGAENRSIIADAPATASRPTFVLLVFAAALVVGGAAAAFYADAQLTLSHYDARAHLVVARRIFDSLTPGWRQLGAVWLPLPHLVDALPVSSDWGYRTGYPVVGVSVIALSAGLAALAGYLLTTTQSRSAALAAPALIVLNPNVLYLQSTPMTEPLLFGLSLVSLAAVGRYLREPTARREMLAGAALSALTLTRYEGWCVAGMLVILAAWARWRAAQPRPWGLAPYVVVSILLFLCLGRSATGQWFVSSGFFVPDNPAFHDPVETSRQVLRSLRELSSPVVLIGAVVGLVMMGPMIVRRHAAHAVLPLALAATAALPWVAFFAGHPHRVRYMVPLVVAASVLASLAIARLPKYVRPAVAALIVVLSCVERPPLDATAPMVVEAQWETPFRVQREAITDYLSGTHDGTPILASMGSLGHYMQESAEAGFDLRDFVHEGNGDLWQAATRSPRRYVNWILTEERAEGGDMLAGLARQDPTFLEGFSRVAEGGGLVLYHREQRPAAP